MPAHWIVLTVPHSEGVTENFAAELAQGLRANGQATQVVTVGPDLGERLRAADPMAAAGIVSIGPLPLSVMVGEVPLYRVVPCPVFMLVLDTPIYDLMKVPAAARFLRDAWQHERLVPLLAEKCFLQRLSAGTEPLLPPQSGYLPFAAFPDRQPTAAPLPVQRRLLVIGALGAELSGDAVRGDLAQTLAEANTLGLDGNTLARVEERLLAPDARGNVMVDLFDLLGLPPRAALAPEVQRFVAAADSRLKRHRRILAVQSLRGVEVDFAGPGWEQRFGDEPGFRFLGTLAHPRLARLMTLYRGVVNFDPNWEWGPHDRVFTALSAGVPVFTHHNLAHAEEGLPDNLVLPFRPNAPALRERAEALLAGPGRTAGTPPPLATRIGWQDRAARLLAHPASATPAAPAVVAA